jgi:threonine/homoserine/homoserine lactone efflux protein
MWSETFKLIYIAITQGLIFGFGSAVLIGPVNFLAIRRGIIGGFQQTFMVGAGAALVDAILAYLVFVGISKEGIVGVGKIVVWGISALFLLFLAYSVLTEIRENPEAMENITVRKQVQWLDNSFVMGVLLVATNPFALIWWVGWVSTLQLSGNIEYAGGGATSFFSAVLVSELIWYSCLALGVHKTRNLFNRKALSVISWICGLGMLVYFLLYVVKVVVNLILHGGAAVTP